jgi:hypothetical protein
VDDGIAIRKLEMRNMDIANYFFSDSTFNYVLEVRPDTISVSM